MNSIEVNHMYKTIKDQEILKDINMSLNPGTIHGFYGRNGSGKTMLLKAVCGLVRPTAGYISINGKKLGEQISFPESLGVIIETVGLWPHLSGMQNLKLLASIKRQINDDDIAEAIRRVGLDPADRRAYQKYSLGMKQRIALAQAIMERPEILVLDEPTNSLDYVGVNLFRDILIQEKKRGATILFSTHIKDDFDMLADRKFYLEAGILTEDLVRKV